MQDREEGETELDADWSKSQLSQRETRELYFVPIRISHRVENACTLLSNLMQTAPGRAQLGLRQLSEATLKGLCGKSCLLTALPLKRDLDSNFLCETHHSFMA